MIAVHLACFTGECGVLLRVFNSALIYNSLFLFSFMLSFLEGIDFYYGSKQHAQKMVDFLQCTVPCRYEAFGSSGSVDLHDTCLLICTPSRVINLASFAVRSCVYGFSFLSRRSKASQRLISHDVHSNSYNYKSTFSVEIVPICKVMRHTMTFSVGNKAGSLQPGST